MTLAHLLDLWLLVHFLVFDSQLISLLGWPFGYFPVLHRIDLSSLNVPMSLTLTDLHKFSLQSQKYANVHES